jgi:SAM-dependent methyltransferase
MRHGVAAWVQRLGERVAPNQWPSLQRRLRRLRRPVRLGTLGKGRPVSELWGFDRGTPVDRYYIEAFLADHRGDIHGRVLEVKDSGYTRRFGVDVRAAEVLDIDDSNRAATAIADLTAADAIPSGQFDCFILTQTLQFIFDTPAALRHAHRLLRPGGVLLATVPSVSRLAPSNGLTSEFWRFTPAACAELFGRAFEGGTVEVRSYGNMTSAVAFLAGAATEEVPRGILDRRDDYFPVIIAVRAVRAGHP